VVAPLLSVAAVVVVAAAAAVVVAAALLSVLQLYAFPVNTK